MSNQYKISILEDQLQCEVNKRRRYVVTDGANADGDAAARAGGHRVEFFRN